MSKHIFTSNNLITSLAITCCSLRHYRFDAQIQLLYLRYVSRPITIRNFFSPCSAKETHIPHDELHHGVFQKDIFNPCLCLSFSIIARFLKKHFCHYFPHLELFTVSLNHLQLISPRVL